MILRFEGKPSTWARDVTLNGEVVPGVVLADEENGIVYTIDTTFEPGKPSPQRPPGVRFLPSGVKRDKAGQWCIRAFRGDVRIIVSAAVRTAVNVPWDTSCLGTTLNA